MKLSLHLMILTCLVAINTASAAEEKWYHDISYEDALKKAKAEKKIVFLDFYTTWCGPCKMLDARTFSKPEMIKWLRENTVALKIDGDRSRKMTTKFQIVSFPTLVFVRPDGTEIDRILGFRPADELIKAGERFKSGKDDLTLTREEIAKGDPKDPSGHLRLANLLAEKGQNNEALKEYLWCLDNGWEGKYADVMVASLPTLFGNMQYLSYHNKEVGEAIRIRRDQSKQALLAGKGGKREIWLYLMGAELFRDDDPKVVYKQVINNEKTSKQVKTDFTMAVLDALLAENQYENIAKYVDLKEQVEKAFSSYEEQKKEVDLQAAGFPPEYRQQFYDQLKAQTVTRTAFVYQVLLGLERTEEAAKLAERILKFDNSGNALHYVAYCGLQSGKPVPANLEHARKAKQLIGKSSVQVYDTLARLYQKMGQKEKAIATAEEGLAAAKEFGQRLQMQKTIDAIKSGKPE